MVARCCNALGRLPVRGLGPRLRRRGTWVRIFLTDDLRVRESLLVDLDRAARASLGNIRILGAVLKAWQGREGNKADKTEKAKHAF